MYDGVDRYYSRSSLLPFTAGAVIGNFMPVAPVEGGTDEDAFSSGDIACDFGFSADSANAMCAAFAAAMITTTMF